MPDVSLALGHQRLVFNVHKNEMVSLWNPITALGSYFFWTKTCLKNERLDRGEKEQHCLNHLRADFYHLKGTSQKSDFHSACTAAISAVLIGCVDIADFFTWVVDMLSLLSATGDGACVWCRCLLRRSLLLAEVQPAVMSGTSDMGTVWSMSEEREREEECGCVWGCLCVCVCVGVFNAVVTYLCTVSPGHCSHDDIYIYTYIHCKSRSPAMNVHIYAE